MVLTDRQFDALFPLVEALGAVESDHPSHPEHNVLEHCLQTLAHARRECDDPELWAAALFHDLGKGAATIEERRDHANIGAAWLYAAGCGGRFPWLVGEHMRVCYYLDGEMTKYSTVRELAHHVWFPYAIWLYRWDKSARNPRRNLRQYFSKDWLVTQLTVPPSLAERLAELGESG